MYIFEKKLKSRVKHVLFVQINPDNELHQQNVYM